MYLLHISMISKILVVFFSVNEEGGDSYKYSMKVSMI